MQFPVFSGWCENRKSGEMQYCIAFRRVFRGAFPVVQILFIQNIVSLFCILPLTLDKKFLGMKTKIFSVHIIRDLSGVLSYYLYFVAIRFLNLVDVWNSALHIFEASWVCLAVRSKGQS